jgi:aryl-alcohol dehydrogenase-like predicted oxidoreductase
MNFATVEGTFSYIKKFPKYSKDFYNFNGDFFISSLGLGSFRKEPYREENYLKQVNFYESTKTALKNGINFIDTASVYRYQESEKEIGRALKDMMEKGEILRENFIVSSKAGFIPLEFPFPENPYEWIDEKIIKTNLAAKEEIVTDQHCMNPKFLKWSLNNSLKNLNIECIDIFFLHNPEAQLGYVERKTVIERIKKAFEFFEEMVEKNKIKYYGIASWNAFLYEETHPEYLSLKEMVDIAKSITEKHHFKYIQTPFNLAKPHMLNYVNQVFEDGKYYTLYQCAKEYGINIINSSPLLQMNLFKGKFNKDVKELTNTFDFSDIITALQFARSNGALSTVFGSINPEHVKENLLLSYIPLAKKENIYKLLFGG